MRMILSLMTFFGSAAYAGDVNIIGMRLCFKDGVQLADGRYNQAMIYLQGRKFELVSRLTTTPASTIVQAREEIEEELRRMEIEANEKIVAPRSLEFVSEGEVVMNDQVAVGWRYQACDNEIEVHNDLNWFSAPGFTGKIAVLGDRLSVCTGKCNQAVAPGEKREVWHFRAVPK